MKKKIRKVSVYRVDHYTGDDIPDDWPQILQSETEYDEEGRIIREAQFSGDGILAEQYVMNYNVNGNPAEMTILDEDGQALEVRRNEYDSQDRLNRMSIEYMDGSVGTTEYVYDARGMLTSKITCDEDGTIEEKESYIHLDGKMVLMERTGEDGEISFRQEDIYENNIHKETKVWSSEEGEPYTRIIRFDKTGRKFAEMKYDANEKLVERINIEEDSEGKLIRIKEENIARKAVTEFGYDSNGNLSNQVELTPGGDVIHQVERTYNDNLDPERINVIYSNPNSHQHDYCLIYQYLYY